MPSQPVDVQIFGRNYTVRAEGDPEYIRELARYVDDKMTEIARQAPTVDPMKISILAALNVCDDLFQFRDQHRKDVRRLEDLEERADVWIRRLEEQLHG